MNHKIEKATKHEHRKSFRKWATPNQRFETLDSCKLALRRMAATLEGKPKPYIQNIGKNNGPLKPSIPARNLSTQFSLTKHSVLTDPRGHKAKAIPSYAYNPQPKAPSRRDKHRAEVAMRKAGA